jgi:hypothetical protein
MGDMWCELVVGDPRLLQELAHLSSCEASLLLALTLSEATDKGSAGSSPNRRPIDGLHKSWLHRAYLFRAHDGFAAQPRQPHAKE